MKQLQFFRVSQARSFAQAERDGALRQIGAHGVPQL